METPLKTGFAQFFSCCPKNLGCPKFGRAAAPLAPPARTPMQWRKSIFKLGKEDMIHMISNVEGESGDGEQGEPILVELSISVHNLLFTTSWGNNGKTVISRSFQYRVGIPK